MAFRSRVSARLNKAPNRPVLLNPLLYHPYFSTSEKYWSWRLYSAHRRLSIIDFPPPVGGFRNAINS